MSIHPYKKRLAVLLTGLLLLLIFTLFSRQVKRGFLHQADFDTTVRIQNEIDRSLHLRLATLVDNVFVGSTMAASPQVTAVFVGLMTIIAVYDWKKKKFHWRALVIPIGFGLLTLGEIYGKSVVNHPSPPFFMIKHPSTIFPQFYINESYSYPSGHTARAIFVALTFLSLISHLLFPTKKRWLIFGGIAFLYVFIVAIGKIYLGEHWLSDVIGGGLLGISFGLTCWSIL